MLPCKGVCAHESSAQSGMESQTSQQGIGVFRPETADCGLVLSGAQPTQYPQEDSNTPNSEAKNGDCEDARHKIRHTARTKRPTSEPKPTPNCDPDLAVVREQWPKLSEAERSAIVAIVRAAVGEVGE